MEGLLNDVISSTSLLDGGIASSLLWLLLDYTYLLISRDQR